MIQRVILIILDSLGVGEMPDAGNFGDKGSNTLKNIYDKRGHLEIPNLCGLGLGQILPIGSNTARIVGCYGKMAEKSVNKDTTTGHWELTGIISDKAFPTFPNGFPSRIIQQFESRINRKILGNYPESGTTIIRDLGEEHMRTGRPIIYTSADSVFQIAAHESIIPLDTLYKYCTIARKLLTGKDAVGRVIARPFIGKPNKFERDNAARRDFSLEPPCVTLPDSIKKNSMFTVGIGKIGDIFGHRGFTREIHTKDNMDGIRQTIKAISEYQGQPGLIFTNLVDFDMVYGHRRNIEGYAKSLEAFDKFIPEIIDSLNETDIVIISADHGCDPSFKKHTDHTREYVPLLVYGKCCKNGINLGTRETFADCGQTIADLMNVDPLPHGTSFKKEILNG